MSEDSHAVDWSVSEVSLIVEDYFDMLRAELLGEPYNKSHHRRALLEQLDNRSDGSAEFKHRNISGYLVELGLPYIDGYKPLPNRQRRVLDPSVDAYLARTPKFFTDLADVPRIRPELSQKRPPTSYADALEEPPEKLVLPSTENKPWLTRKPRHIDFVKRDATNRKLGKLGEEYVVEFEKFRLRTIGRDDLADRVEWVAQTIGDGLGFDILSYDESDEAERFIEVKTTGLGKFFPFYVTKNEVRCSADVTNHFQLYRLFNFSRDPRLFILAGSLRTTCTLEPIQYRGSIG